MAKEVVPWRGVAKMAWTRWREEGCHGVELRGVARPNCGIKIQGVAWDGMEQVGVAWQGMAGLGMEWQQSERIRQSKTQRRTDWRG